LTLCNISSFTIGPAGLFQPSPAPHFKNTPVISDLFSEVYTAKLQM
jgi:hypothetical protein